jgi:hypothetical protein
MSFDLPSLFGGKAKAEPAVNPIVENAESMAPIRTHAYFIGPTLVWYKAKYVQQSPTSEAGWKVLSNKIVLNSKDISRSPEEKELVPSVIGIFPHFYDAVKEMCDLEKSRGNPELNFDDQLPDWEKAVEYFRPLANKRGIIFDRHQDPHQTHQGEIPDEGYFPLAQIEIIREAWLMRNLETGATPQEIGPLLQRHTSQIEALKTAAKHIGEVFDILNLSNFYENDFRNASYNKSNKNIFKASPEDIYQRTSYGSDNIRMIRPETPGGACSVRIKAAKEILLGTFPEQKDQFSTLDERLVDVLNVAKMYFVKISHGLSVMDQEELTKISSRYASEEKVGLHIEQLGSFFNVSGLMPILAAGHQLSEDFEVYSRVFQSVGAAMTHKAGELQEKVDHIQKALDKSRNQIDVSKPANFFQRLGLNFP